MSKNEIVQLLEENEGLLKGHFKLSSGNHSDKYVQCEKVIQYPQISGKLGKIIAEPFKETGIDVVFAPAIGAIRIGHEVARALECRSVFAERVNGVFQIRRAMEISEGEKVLLVEDVVTTGKSLKELIPLVESMKGKVVGVASLIDRTGGKVDFGVSFKGALQLEIPIYTPEECPMCKEGIPLVKPGSRPEGSKSI